MGGVFKYVSEGPAESKYKTCTLATAEIVKIKILPMQADFNGKIIDKFYLMWQIV